MRTSQQSYVVDLTLDTLENIREGWGGGGGKKENKLTNHVINISK
jgi:hypothetical protein